MICAGCARPRSREACPTCDGAAAQRAALERAQADAEGRRWGNLFREREVRELKLEGVRWTAEVMTQRAHRASASAAELGRQVERLEARLGAALRRSEDAELERDEHQCEALAGGALDAQASAEQRLFAANAERSEAVERAADLEHRLAAREDEDQRALDLAFAALKGVEPAVKPCHYAEPCGKCPACRFRQALDLFRERYPEEAAGG